MRRHGRLSGVGRAKAGLGLAVLAVVWALSVISPGAAAAAPGASHRVRATSSDVGMSLSQAPPALRSAVQNALDSPARSAAPPKQQAELSASDAASGNQFGYSVAVSGSTAVVGAPYRNSTAGAAYVFVHSGSGWSQQAELTASDGAAGADFGYSVSVSGSTVMVGAPGHSSATGAAYVFVRSGSAWSQQAELSASDAAQGDHFGSSVGLSVTVSKSTAIVGAPDRNSFTGAAYVFVRSGTAWSQQGELTASDGAQGDDFAYSVAVSGSTTVVGAPFHNSSTGLAYVFARSGTTWTQEAELTASDGVSGDNFGQAVAVSGSAAVVGAPFHNSSTGAAYVFARSGTTWSQQAELTATRGASGNNFGYSVAASGSIAVVGAPDRHSFTGAAYLFVRSGSGWSERAKLIASDAAPTNYFGQAVSVSGSTALIGAPFHNSDAGAAYVFRLPSG